MNSTNNAGTNNAGTNNAGTVNDRTPVLVGAGQFMQRPDNPTEALEPLAMMGEALQAAAEDATGNGTSAGAGTGAGGGSASNGTGALLRSATHIWVVKGAWPYPNPGAALAQRFGADARTGLSADGGNTPQALVNQACLAIARGDANVVMIVGAEGIWSRRRAKRAGERIPYTTQTDSVPDDQLGKDVTMNNETEIERGLQMPINIYPLFELAFRHWRGESVDAHRDRLAQLWEKFNQVACANPYSWVRTPMTAEQISDPGSGNRMVGFPYTKAMNSNWDLDQAAALILCSAEAARSAGVPTDRWVFPHSGTDGNDTEFVSNRANLYSSPAIRVAGRRAMALAGVGPDELDHVDLYSCFPSAVQISATELGLGLDRSLTETGGLTFAGGPLNNYVTHSIATMANVLRDQPGSIGLCSANGGYLTKHAFGIYSTTPPAAGEFAYENCQPEIDQFPKVELAADYTGKATLETYTVMHDAEGPKVALAAVRTGTGNGVGTNGAGTGGGGAGENSGTGNGALDGTSARQWVRNDNPKMLKALMSSEHIGHTVEVKPDFSFVPAR